MRRKARTKRVEGRGGGLLAIACVALVVAFLLLRLIAFMAHARRF